MKHQRLFDAGEKGMSQMAMLYIEKEINQVIKHLRLRCVKVNVKTGRIKLRHSSIRVVFTVVQL